MKRLNVGAMVRVGAFSLLGVCTGQLALAQPYSISQHAITAGGGTSSGGGYTISGSIGQPAAGVTMAGGSYSITGGFWSLLSVLENPGAPNLTVYLTSTNTLLISWPSPSTGWQLQQGAQLDSPNWVSLAPSINDDGVRRSVVVVPEPGQRFYRLYRSTAQSP